MALRPLRSVGRFSTAMDPSKVSKWQYTTLQRTQPEAHLTNRAKQYHPDYEVMRINSAASLRLTEAENRLTEAERRLQSEKERKETLKSEWDATKKGMRDEIYGWSRASMIGPDRSSVVA